MVSWLTPNIVNGGAGWKVVRTHFDPGPFPPADDKWRENQTSIVVLVAALRETRLAATLESFFKNAAFPNRIFFAVVQQNTEDEPDIIESYCEKMGSKAIKHIDEAGKVVFSYPQKKCPFVDQIRVIRMDASEARGPVYARARQAELLEPSDQFCMQIDAHTVVIDKWDLRILAEWGVTNNEYAVLTAYPTNFKDLYENSNGHWEMPHMCGAAFEGFGKVRNLQASAAANLQVPILSPLWAAGLSFHRCHAERIVPNDINLKGVFSGEEFSRGARLWTHGYDFYSIRRPIVGTYYGGEKGGKGSWRASPEESAFANNRMATLLKWPGSNQTLEAQEALQPLHALGTRRSLEMYINFSGVDTINQKIIRTCDSLVYVPWISKDSAYSESGKNTADTVREGMLIDRRIGLLGIHVSRHGLEVQSTELLSLRGIMACVLAGIIFVFVFVRVQKWLRQKPPNSKYSL